MTIRTLAAVIALAAAAPAWSANDFYVGLRAGSDLDGRLDDQGGNIDSDNPWGGYAGWRINDTLALELGLSDLGNSTRSGIAEGGLDLDGALYQFGLVARVPLADSFYVLGAIGAFRRDEDGTAGTIAGPRRIDLSETGGYVELGGAYRFNEQWSLRASYTWFDFDGGSDGNFWGGVQLDF